MLVVVTFQNNLVLLHYLAFDRLDSISVARYPRIVDDLSNWQSRSVAGSNGAVIVAAETSTISWGSSVAGELG